MIVNLRKNNFPRLERGMKALRVGMMIIVLKAFITPLMATIPHSEEIKPFTQSFIAHYEANINGKFTHEYHHFLLKKTAKSLDGLEASLCENGLNLAGRVVLMGYEEQGVPRYYTDHREHLFSDEMAHKTSAGWSLKMFNRFGLLSGFLGKDVNLISRYWEKAKGTALPVTHINPDQVEIFDGQGTLFQEHAFGDAYKPVMHFHAQVESSLLSGKMDDILTKFMGFWKVLYNQELKITGKQHIVGTQDILFSISYAEYLNRSGLPLHHFYLGPDITYPIEVSSVQSREQTRHSQAFIKQFVPRLQPVNNKKTVYVFCSFVDGVGKSTMLGNVQNWMKHGSQVERYQPVDNSSSQLATVFQFSDDVWIADLPAQVSHFTYKPDGYVFAPIGATEDTTEQIESVREYVKKDEEKLCEQFAKRCVAIDARIAAEGMDAVHNAEDKQDAYVANLSLLKKHDANTWVSFAHEDKTYLFDRDNPGKLRVLVPLATAPSHGLKNNCPEQMIFSLGVRLPLSYPNFLRDLNKKLQAAGVEEVVMVDFLSMYSRSSRENIRVNYVVQQLALLHHDFALEHSFYQNFVDNAQLLTELDVSAHKEAFMRSLLQETITRTVLYLLLLEHADSSIAGMPISQVTKKIREVIKQLPREALKQLDQLVESKINLEHKSLHRLYGTTREYVLTQQFQGKDLFVFSEKIRKLFGKRIKNERIQKMWKLFDEATQVKSETLATDRYTDQLFGELDNGCKVRLIGRVPLNCRDRNEVLRPLRELRAMWYATLTNLLFSISDSSEKHFMVQEKFAVPPVIVLPDDTGKLCIVTPIFDPITKEYEMPEYRLFLEKDPPGDGAKWGVFDDQLYLTDWSCVKRTNAGVFAFCHEIQEKDKANSYYYGKPQVTTVTQRFHNEEGGEHVACAQLVREKMEPWCGAWMIKYWKDEVVREAKKNGKYKPETPTPRNRQRDEWGGVKQGTKTDIHELNPEQYPGVRLCLRLLATLEMIAKDGDADIASRRGNKDDFWATLELLERITLPACFGLHAPEPLWRERRKVKPVGGWKYFS